jgi:hypothetical protein
VPLVEYYKSGRNGVATDIIASQDFYSRNYAGVKTLFAKMEASIRNTALSNDDGAIGMFATLNGVLSEFFRFNGADGENNSFYPIDMNNQAIKTSTGSLALSATSSTGTGQITLAPKTGSNLTIATTPSGTNKTIISVDGTQTSMTNTPTATAFISTIQFVNNALASTYMFLQQDYGGALLKNIYLLCNSATGNTLESTDRHTPTIPFKIKVDNGSFATSNSSLEIDMNPANNPLVLAQLTFTHDNTLVSGGTLTTNAYIPVLIAGTQYYIPITTSPT